MLGQKEETRYRDVLFAILFILHLGLVGALLVFAVAKSQPDAQDFIIDPHKAVPVAVILGVAGAAGLINSIAWLQIARVFTTALIYISIVFTCAIQVAFALYMFAVGLLWWGVLSLLFAAFMIFFFYIWRRHIPFCVALLQTVVDLTNRYPATVAASIISMFVHLIWTIIWVIVVVLTLRFSQTASTILFVLLLFSYFWTSQVIKNIVHVTVSGTFATWYFLNPNMPENPTLSSFKRATSYSFGSICLGSMLVALIQTVRAIVRSLRNTENGILVFVIDCILSCIDSLIQYFNHYAFVMVAIYGKGFWQSAKDTFRMFQDTGLMPVVNDNIVGTVLSLGCFIVASISAVVGGLLAFFWLGSEVIFAAIVSFAIGFSFCIMTMQVIESGTATIFVCFAEDPVALHRNSPLLYETFVTTYQGLGAPSLPV